MLAGPVPKDTSWRVEQNEREIVYTGEKKQIAGRTVTLKVKYQDFRICTRARSLDRAVADREEFFDIGVRLLRTLLPPRSGIRLLGLTLSNLTEGEAPAEPVFVLQGEL